MPAEGLLDEVVRLYAEAAGPMLLQLIPIALGLAGTLFTLQIAWDGAMWVLLDSDEIFGKALRKGTIFLILYGLISQAPAWLPELLEGFSELGRAVTGLEGLSPAAILAQGLDLSFTFFNSWDRFLSALSPLVAIYRIASMLIVLTAFGLIALQLARVLIEASLALGALVVFLGFAGHRMSFSLAEGYLRYLLDLGIRLYVLFIVVAIGRDLGRRWDEMLQGFDLLNLRLHVAILVSAVLFALLAWSLPRDIASRIAGSFSLSGHNPLRDSG